MDEEGLPQGRLKRLMGDAFLKELKELLAGGFTGTVTLHVHEGAVKMFETNQRRRPRADQVELTEVEKGR